MLALEEWRHYLIGAKDIFEIWTDHQNLQYFRQPQKVNHWQARWLTELTQYHVTLHHKPGASNIKPRLNRQLIHPTILGSDSQALIKALDNQRSHAGQYILDNIHLFAEQLHAKQDALINHDSCSEAVNANRSWKGRVKGVIDPQIHWVPGHCDFGPNKLADEEAKKAAEGNSSDTRLLPAFLHKRLPLSISALRQNNITKLKNHWERRWRLSPREDLLWSIDNTAPSKKYICLTKSLDRRQSSILFQLHTGHIGLNHHLFRIRKSESPSCLHCQGITVEMVKHFLLDCPFYRKERHTLQRKLCRNAGSLSFLLNNPAAVIPLLKLVHSTGCFKSFFSKDNKDKIRTNACNIAELRASAAAFEASLNPNLNRS